MPYRYTYQPGPDLLTTITSGIPRRYDPTVFLEYGQVTSTFDAHLNRDPPSSSPGTDVDMPDLIRTTENLPIEQRPLVHSPVTGIVRDVKAQPWGRITIEDLSGYTHTLMHNENILVRKGQFVRIYDPVASIGRVAPPSADIKKDHVHTTVRDAGGNMVDDTNLWYDSYTGQVLFNEDNDWVGRFSGAAEFQRAKQSEDVSSIFDRFTDLLTDMLERIDRMNSKLDTAQERQEQSHGPP